MRLTSIFSPVLDLLFPRRCPACAAGFEASTLFCPDCESEMDAIESAESCRRCGAPVPSEGLVCPHCSGRGIPPFAGVMSLGVFRGPIKAAVKHAKYEHRWPLMERLADRLLDKRDLKTWLHGVDALVPVPLHPTRQRDRGFNQADVIARRIRRQIRRPVIVPAVRTRATETQTHMSSANKRAKNLQDAFALIDPSLVAGKHLALVDDVMTTGSTLVALARALRAAKPARLSVIVLCVADPRGREFEVI